jgi:hypothetical protein
MLILIGKSQAGIPDLRPEYAQKDIGEELDWRPLICAA